MIRAVSHFTAVLIGQRPAGAFARDFAPRFGSMTARRRQSRSRRRSAAMTVARASLGSLSNFTVPAYSVDGRAGVRIPGRQHGAGLDVTGRSSTMQRGAITGPCERLKRSRPLSSAISAATPERVMTIFSPLALVERSGSRPRKRIRPALLRRLCCGRQASRRPRRRRGRKRIVSWVPGSPI